MNEPRSLLCSFPGCQAVALPPSPFHPPVELRKNSEILLRFPGSHFMSFFTDRELMSLNKKA